MILALSVLLVSGALVLAGPRALGRLTRSGSHPMPAIAAWQAASWSVVGGIVLAATMLAAPILDEVGWMPAGLEACLGAMGHVHGSTDHPVMETVALLLLAGVLFRLAACGVRAWWVTHSVRARHRTLLSLVGRHEPRLDARVVDDDTAAVYCLPGRGGGVLFTSGALVRLSGAQRRAVVAHERAHLRGRHDLLVASAALLRTAFPRVRLFDQAWKQTVALIEMRADDVAARRHGGRQGSGTNDPEQLATCWTDGTSCHHSIELRSLRERPAPDRGSGCPSPGSHLRRRARSRRRDRPRPRPCRSCRPG